MIKLIVCDLDGTLFNKYQQITPFSADVINKATASKIEFMMATGRCYDMVSEYLEKYHLDCDLILNNGATYMSKNREDIRYFPIEHEKLQEVVPLLQKYHFHISMHTTKGKYIFEDLEEYYDSHYKRVSNFFGDEDPTEFMKAPFFRKDGFLYNTHVISSLDEMFKDGAEVLKIDADVEDEKDGLACQEELQKVSHILLSMSYPLYTEVCSDKTHKGSLLKTICEEKGYQNHEVAVFGDSTNDIQMLEMFENSYVVENGHPLAKEVGKYLIDSNNNDGVAKAVLKIIEDNKKG